MPTEAQTKANRQNAEASTGPRTAGGKSRSSANALGLGLFSTQNCVQPEEQEEYDALCHSLWEDLNPVGATEQMFATEIIRGAWRLRRCAAVEGSLSGWVDREVRKSHTQTYGGKVPFDTAKDPLFYTFSNEKQIRVDRARAQATSGVRRATAELRCLQTERLLRSALLPTGTGMGLASLKELLPLIGAEEKKKLLQTQTIVATDAPCIVSAGERESAAETENTNRTQSTTAGAADPTPRNAFCPCGKGLKYKRCCGKSAPPVLHSPLKMAA